MNRVIVVLIDEALITPIGVLAILYLPHPSKVCVTSTHSGSAGGPTGGEESLCYRYPFSREAQKT